MFSAKIFFDDKLGPKFKVVKTTINAYPEEYRKRFLANARILTPKDSGWLRKSIITQVTGYTVKVGWRAKYAMVVNAGGHTVPRPVRGMNPKAGEYSTIAAGFYRHKTGNKGFADRTAKLTNEEMNLWVKGKIK